MTKPSYIDERIEQMAEEQGTDIKEAAKDFLQRSKHIVQLEQLQPQVHRWIDRGAVMSCEFAGHPAHRSFKIGG